MSPQALLCSADPQVVAAIQRVLNSSGIELEVCTQAEAAVFRLNQAKFDAVFVDCDDLPLGLELLRDLRGTRSNRQAIAFALLRGATSMGRAFELGANFALEKPLTIEATSRTLHAATGLIVHERRRYFRQDVATRVKVWVRNSECSALMTNLSATGMLLTQVELPAGAKVRFAYTLPWSEIAVNGSGVVMWSGGGMAGLRTMLPKETQRALLDWVNDRAFRDKQFSSAVEELSYSALPGASAARRRARA